MATFPTRKCIICSATIPRHGNEPEGRYNRRRCCYNPVAKGGKKQLTACERKAMSSSTWGKTGERKAPNQNRSAGYLQRKAEMNRKARVDKWEQKPERTFTESAESCALRDVIGTHDIDAWQVPPVRVLSREEIRELEALYLPPTGPQRIGPTVPRRD